MRINRSVNIHSMINGYKKDSRKVSGTNPYKSGLDQLDISQNAKDFHTAMDAFKKLPEVRQDKVDSIAEQIRGGQYNPSSEDVVDKMFNGIG